jgi:hypothetical protein
MEFGDVHVPDPQGRQRPAMLESRVVVGRSYALDELISAALTLNPGATIAVRLDIEGGEWWAMRRLVERPDVLCGVSQLFVEYHSAANEAQRTRLASYGFRHNEFDWLKDRVHAAMEEIPGCRLQLNWRSFWASCGDQQRFEWRDSPQAMEGRPP